MAAIEKLAFDTNYPITKLATELGITTKTLRLWQRSVDFNQAVYDRFMDVAGRHMPDVVMAQIREALEGNTQAATLILKHFGKFQDTLTVKIESPFDQFLRNRLVNDNKQFTEEAEIVEDDAVAIGKSFEIPDTLPPRNPKNDVPRNVKIENNKKLKKSYKRNNYLKNRNERYHWLQRAKAVNIDPLPKGRPTQETLRKWHNSIIDEEIKFANGILGKEQKSPK